MATAVTWSIHQDDAKIGTTEELDDLQAHRMVDTGMATYASSEDAAAAADVAAELVPESTPVPIAAKVGDITTNPADSGDDSEQSSTDDTASDTSPADDTAGNASPADDTAGDDTADVTEDAATDGAPRSGRGRRSPTSKS